MIRISNVLVATDFGPASDPAVSYGREFARTFGARLHVLHVVDNPIVYSGTEAVGVNFAQIQADLEAAARQAMDRTVTAEDREQLRAVSAILTGPPAFEIAEYARVNEIDMVIVGTHGRRMISHLLLGSVAEKVVRIAPCPVLTVRPSERDFIQPDALQAAESARK
jgi:nucleotide-binding universal stress UspA family protein